MQGIEAIPAARGCQLDAGRALVPGVGARLPEVAADDDQLRPVVCGPVAQLKLDLGAHHSVPVVPLEHVGKLHAPAVIARHQAAVSAAGCQRWVVGLDQQVAALDPHNLTGPGVLVVPLLGPVGQSVQIADLRPGHIHLDLQFQRRGEDVAEECPGGQAVLADPPRESGAGYHHLDLVGDLLDHHNLDAAANGAPAAAGQDIGNVGGHGLDLLDHQLLVGFADRQDAEVSQTMNAGGLVLLLYHRPHRLAIAPVDGVEHPLDVDALDDSNGRERAGRGLADGLLRGHGLLLTIVQKYSVYIIL